MKAKHTEHVKEIEEWKGKYLRALADYQNLERRAQENERNDKKMRAREIILKFLPVLDDLYKAQPQIKNEGLVLIIAKFEAVLKSEQVERKESLQQKFNSHLMECTGIVEGKKDDEVVEEIRPAYLMSGDVIRTAQVIVSKVSRRTGSASG